MNSNTNTSKKLALVLAVAALAIIAYSLFGRKAAPVSQEPAKAVAPVVAAPAPATTVTEQPAATNAAAVAPETEPPPTTPTPETLATTPGKVLATVNGVEIKGADLALFGKDFGEKAQDFSIPAFEYLLNEAIARELIFEAAKKDGIELTDDERAKLKKDREEVATRMNSPAFGNVHYNGTIEEQADFEQRNAEAQMLLSAMLVKRGILPPSDASAEDVKKFYDEHKDEYGSLPKEGKARDVTWQRIDYEIRQKMGYVAYSAYAAERRKVLAELRGAADVSVKVKIPEQPAPVPEQNPP